MALTREQKTLLGRVMSTSAWKQASPRERKALVEAGIVESGLRNLNYGDRDSKGFLQQRPSQGWLNPTSIEQATQNFLSRARAGNTDKGSAGELAPRVQRSAFPGRYQQQSGTADAILRRSGGTAAPRSTVTASTTPGVDRSKQRQAAISAYVSSRYQPDAAANLALGLAAAKDTPPRTVTRRENAPTSAPRSSGAYPLGRRGKVIGTPYSGTHAKAFNIQGGSDNWQSENAEDIAIPVGTPVYAVADGVLGNTGSLGQGGRFAGLRTNLIGKNNAWYYAHLSRLAAGIHAGAHVRKGQLLGYSGSANGVAHLHFAQQKGDPRR